MTRPGESPSWCLDFNAGGPVHPDVLACFVEVQRTCPANPASVHAPGRRARALLEEARARIARVLGLRADDVVFPSGGTEAANMAVAGLGDPALPVQLSAVEHPAVYEPAQRRGVRWWGVDARGVVRPEPPTEPIGLVALAHAQSELGTLQPVAAAAALAYQRAVPLLVDAAQTLGRVDLQPVLAAQAFVVLSPHKAGGLRGLGVLAGPDLAQRLRPLLHGGGQEHGLRPGTQSPALAMANALAIERATALQRETAAAMGTARAAFVDALGAARCHHVVLTPLADSLPNTLMVQFPGIDGRSLLPALDLAGVHASHGSACSSGAPTPPRILTAIGLADDAARACVRFSFAGGEAAASLREAAARVAQVVARLGKKSAR
ncbi:MAG: aminotransferase class V-fold PLP-dependent enzyme [Planctomycetes bacterium]|nr:aminotransferase class V-fold PLP-dependent enzyme [Planctomycetota bacterium]